MLPRIATTLSKGSPSQMTFATVCEYLPALQMTARCLLVICLGPANDLLQSCGVLCIPLG